MANPAPLTLPVDRELRPAPVLDLVLPVYNEAGTLGASVDRLYRYLRDRFPWTWRITIVDNASTDATWAESCRLAAGLTRVHALHLERKGRGGALRAAWSTSDAEAVAYSDIDLSTDLSALGPMVALVVLGHSDVSIGCRLTPGARVQRRLGREVVSRAYNRLLQTVFGNRFRDAQCGFKVVRAEVARQLLPAVKSNSWFFDTELLLLAERNGLRVTEIPVDWVEDPSSTVSVFRTALEDLAGAARMAAQFWRGRGCLDLGGIGRRPAPSGTGGELLRRAAVVVAWSALYLGLFLWLRAPLGSFTANAVALSAAVVAASLLGRRQTVGTEHPVARRHRRIGAYLGAWALTSGALAAAAAVDGGTVDTQLLLLGVASALAVVLWLAARSIAGLRRRALQLSFSEPEAER